MDRAPLPHAGGPLDASMVEFAAFPCGDTDDRNTGNAANETGTGLGSSHVEIRVAATGYAISSSTTTSSTINDTCVCSPPSVSETAPPTVTCPLSPRDGSPRASAAVVAVANTTKDYTNDHPDRCSDGTSSSPHPMSPAAIWAAAISLHNPEELAYAAQQAARGRSKSTSISHTEVPSGSAVTAGAAHDGGSVGMTSTGDVSTLTPAAPHIDFPVPVMSGSGASALGWRPPPAHACRGAQPGVTGESAVEEDAGAARAPSAGASIESGPALPPMHGGGRTASSSLRSFFSSEQSASSGSMPSDSTASATGTHFHRSNKGRSMLRQVLRKVPVAAGGAEGSPLILTCGQFAQLSEGSASTGTRTTATNASSSIQSAMSLHRDPPSVTGISGAAVAGSLQDFSHHTFNSSLHSGASANPPGGGDQPQPILPVRQQQSPSFTPSLISVVGGGRAEKVCSSNASSSMTSSRLGLALPVLVGGSSPSPHFFAALGGGSPNLFAARGGTREAAVSLRSHGNSGSRSAPTSATTTTTMTTAAATSLSSMDCLPVPSPQKVTGVWCTVRKHCEGTEAPEPSTVSVPSLVGIYDQEPPERRGDDDGSDQINNARISGSSGVEGHAAAATAATVAVGTVRRGENSTADMGTCRDDNDTDGGGSAPSHRDSLSQRSSFSVAGTARPTSSNAPLVTLQQDDDRIPSTEHNASPDEASTGQPPYGMNASSAPLGIPMMTASLSSVQCSLLHSCAGDGPATASAHSASIFPAGRKDTANAVPEKEIPQMGAATTAIQTADVGDNSATVKARALAPDLYDEWRLVETLRGRRRETAPIAEPGPKIEAPSSSSPVFLWEPFLFSECLQSPRRGKPQPPTGPPVTAANANTTSSVSVSGADDISVSTSTSSFRL